MSLVKKKKFKKGDLIVRTEHSRWWDKDRIVKATQNERGNHLIIGENRIPTRIVRHASEREVEFYNKGVKFLSQIPILPKFVAIW